MPAITDFTQKLVTRDYYYGSSWGGGGARWAFFAIFLIVVAVMVLGAIRVNKKRTAQGIQPIYGTRWMTPPSYLQSQGQYNQPTRTEPGMPNAYVPTYTQTANDGDMGYYAADGTFHPNPNAKGPAFPDNVHQRLTTNADGQPILDFNNSGNTVVNDEHDLDFTRPTGPPPSSRINRNNTTGSVSAEERPDHPPPSANGNTTGTSSTVYERPDHPPPSAR